MGILIYGQLKAHFIFSSHHPYHPTLGFKHSIAIRAQNPADGKRIPFPAIFRMDAAVASLNCLTSLVGRVQKGLDTLVETPDSKYTESLLLAMRY